MVKYFIFCKFTAVRKITVNLYIRNTAYCYLSPFTVKIVSRITVILTVYYIYGNMRAKLQMNRFITVGLCVSGVGHLTPG